MGVAFSVLAFGNNFLSDLREPAAVMRQCLGIDLATGMIFSMFSPLTWICFLIKGIPLRSAWHYPAFPGSRKETSVAIGR